MEYINDGCYAVRQRHRCLKPQPPPRISEEPARLSLEERLRLYQRIRQNWGTEKCEDPNEIFSKADQGLIGFQKITAKDGAIQYISDALEALVLSEDTVTVESIRVEPTENGYVAEFRGKELTLHVTSLDDKTYIIHGYGKRLTETAQKRVSLLRHPQMNVPYHLLLEHPLFEKLGSTIGIQNAAPEQLYHGGVRILKTQDPQQLKTAVEIFGKKYGIETIHCEIKGNKKVVMINNRSQRMHIEYANDTFTVCVYDPSPQLNSVQQTTIRSLDQAQQIEPHEHTVLVYIDYFAPGVLKEGPFPYSIQIKTRKPEKIRVNTRPIVRRFETIEQICTHITTTLPNEVINMLSDSCSITFGFSTYDMKKQFDPTSTESIYDAYTTALSRAIVSGIQAQSFTTKTIQGTSHQDAGDVCFEKYYC